MTVDVDDEGNILYRFPAIHWGGLPRMAPNAPPPVRVEAPPMPTRVAVGADPREQELEEELAAAEPGRRKAR
ncbi:MAG: hypothetical protein K0S65_3786 [Labilithrix sp.]|nr:hypothetical protein [Labilithrix sp.]